MKKIAYNIAAVLFLMLTLAAGSTIVAIVTLAGFIYCIQKAGVVDFIEELKKDY